MEKVRAKVIGRPILKTAVGGMVELSPRDARILSRLGRVEIIPPAEDVDFTPATALEDAILTPEAELRTTAHEAGGGKPKKRARRARKPKA